MLSRAVGLVPGTAASAATPGRVKAAPEGKPRLNLQAVLVAGSHSIANVDGVFFGSDFITVSKTPKAAWKEVTPAVKRLLVSISGTK